MKNYPVSRKDNLVVQEMDGEVLIYDLTENKAFCLNQTSALIWQSCDGTRNTAEITEFLSQKLNSPANEDLVWFALDQLKKEKLIENDHPLPDNFAGMSRREVIKKVGLGSMIALPIVASMVAPSAVLAQSCTGTGTGIGGSCTSDIDCESCCCNINSCIIGGTVGNGMNANTVCACVQGTMLINGMCTA
jgi:hypothetical protein